MAFLRGTLVQYFVDLLSKHFEFHCSTSVGKKLADIASIQAKKE
ncbi:hypothetical protein [Galactobacillus timonensis]|nr:hypothetical protein [Galactobacillus timonensis]